MNSVKIGKYEIGIGTKPFIVAEMSGNHNQSLERALKLVDAAASSGAHALKLQTYTPDTMTLRVNKPGFFVQDKNSLWSGEHLYDLYTKAQTPWEWHKPIFDRCREKGVLCFSTPFDETAVDFLLELDVPCFKIASFENTDLPLIRRVAKTGKPLIISTGMATLAELVETVATAREAGASQLILLKCTSAYPAMPSEINLKTIPHMSQLFNLPVGLSDHTMGLGVPLAAVSLGVSFIEKHFTLSRDDGGVDSAFSLNQEELKDLVEEAEKAWLALGCPHYGQTENESKSLRFRRSIYVTKDIAAGETLTLGNVRCIRPGFGLKPKHFESILGMKANKSIELGTPLSWDLLDGVSPVDMQ